MKEWLRNLWADVPGRIALVLLLSTAIPAWFIWPERPAMEAIQCVVIAGFLLTVWSRGLMGSEHPLVGPGVLLASCGLLLEAAFFTFADERPTPVLFIFPIGVLLVLMASLLERRRGKPAS